MLGKTQGVALGYLLPIEVCMTRVQKEDGGRGLAERFRLLDGGLLMIKLFGKGGRSRGTSAWLRQILKISAAVGSCPIFFQGLDLTVRSRGMITTFGLGETDRLVKMPSPSFTLMEAEEGILRRSRRMLRDYPCQMAMQPSKQ